MIKIFVACFVIACVLYVIGKLMELAGNIIEIFTCKQEAKHGYHQD